MVRGLPVFRPTPVLCSAMIWILSISEYRGMLMCSLIDGIKIKHFVGILGRLNQRLFRNLFLSRKPE